MTTLPAGLALPLVPAPPTTPSATPTAVPADPPAAATTGRRGAARSTRARALRASLWSVVVLFAGAYAAFLLAPVWYAAQGQRLLVVTSGSMSPAFDAGDAVVLQPITDPSTLRVGQVVSFWPPGSDDLVTHRIRDLTMLPVLEQDTTTGRMVPVLGADGQPIRRPYLITQGDANPVRDPDAVPVSRVRGVVLGVHPSWGAVLAFAHGDLGRLVLLAPPLAALAGMEVASVLQGRRRKPSVDTDRVRADDLLLG